MPIMRLVFWGSMVFIGAIALFLGGVVMLSALQSGIIELGYTQAGKEVSEKVTRAANAGRFWQLFSAMGLAPFVCGGLAVLFGVRTLRQPPPE